MNNKEIIEGNKLIGKFMNWDKWTPCDYTCDCDGSSIPLHSFCETSFGITAKYHTSWDWLMLVIEKIEQLEGISSVSINELYNSFYIQIKNLTSTTFYCRISVILWKKENQYCSEYIKSNYYKEHTGNNKIELVWSMIVAFIKWYNKNNKV